MKARLGQGPMSSVILNDIPLRTMGSWVQWIKSMGFEPVEVVFLMGKDNAPALGIRFQKKTDAKNFLASMKNSA